MTSLGKMLATGRGATKDEAKAVELFRKAIDLGHAAAANHLGVMYENGWGVCRDLGEAVTWYRKGAAAGDDLAKAALKRLGKE